MIPKIIHYCWFGRGEQPEIIKKCIDTWKVILPDYQIIGWNEDNFDINAYRFAAEAYKERKFAFTSDVCRLHVLKEMGGIYLDTDVEFLKPLPEEMLNTMAFTGFEDNHLISTAIMATEANSKWISDILEYYIDRSFYLADGSFDINPNTEIITDLMVRNNGLVINNSYQVLKDYCVIYPSEYFSPKSWKTLKTKITENTYCNHHFTASWLQEEYSFLGKMANKLLGKRFANVLSEQFRKLKSGK